MTVKIIPITPEYREGWEQTFKNKSMVVYKPAYKCLVCGRNDLIKMGRYTCYNSKEGLCICDNCRPNTVYELDKILKKGRLDKQEEQA